MFYDLKQNSIQLSYANTYDNVNVSQNEDNSNEYQNPNLVSDLLNLYLESNPNIGYLVFQVSQESLLEGILPSPNAKVTLSKPMGNDLYVSRILTTDENGKTIPISLPTVSSDLSLVPSNQNPYSTYNATIESPGFVTVELFDIPVFENITSIQPIRLVPTPNGVSQPIQQFNEQEPLSAS